MSFTMIFYFMFQTSAQTLTAERSKRYVINPLGHKWRHHNITYRLDWSQEKKNG